MKYTLLMGSILGLKTQYIDFFLTFDTKYAIIHGKGEIVSVFYPFFLLTARRHCRGLFIFME